MTDTLSLQTVLRYVDQTRGEVFCLREDGAPSWAVTFGGRVCSPRWREKGPALAYLAALQRGRTPEYSQ